MRQGSVRLAKKNYLKLNGEAIFEIAVKKALAVELFDKIVLNTDDPSLESVAYKLGVDFYLRPSELASSEATSEMVVLDFLEQYNCERVFWLNTVSPLQTIDDIKSFFIILSMKIAPHLSPLQSIKFIQLSKHCH